MSDPSSQQQAPAPTRLDLKKDEKLTVVWPDGRTCVYPISMLRSLCPCAHCRELREEHKKRPLGLNVLPGDHSQGPIVVSGAHLVGNYALKIEWSDGHDTGIYSWEYLREICPQTPIGSTGSRT